MSGKHYPCPFCGRESAVRPSGTHQPHTHVIERTPAGSLAVRCWYCGCRGPLADSPRQAVDRWAYSADKSGAPKW